MKTIQDCRASKLYLLCVSCNWDEALALVATHPEEAQKLLYTAQRGAASISALHVVLAHAKCRGGVPFELVRALSNAAPDLVMHRHSYTGNLPLHAVFYNPFFSASKRSQIAAILLEANMASAVAKNQDERTPLHTICSQHCNFGPLSLLLDVAQNTASWSDKNGDLPLHLACRSLKSPNKSIVALYNAYPQGLLQANGVGMTPVCIVKEIQGGITFSTPSTSISKCHSVLQLLSRLEKACGAPYEQNIDACHADSSKMQRGTKRPRADTAVTAVKVLSCEKKHTKVRLPRALTCSPTNVLDIDMHTGICEVVPVKEMEVSIAHILLSFRYGMQREDAREQSHTSCRL
jgi:hypothetical protein